MKKRNRIVALLIAVVMVMMLAAGCGPKKPTADDAKAYVQATLDLICTGDYDHSVNLVDVEEGQEAAVREEMIAAARDQVMSSGYFSDETADLFEEFMLKCFAKAKYEVGDAVETEDGGYDVTVTIEPLKAYEGSDEFINNITIDDLDCSIDEFMAMSENDQNQAVLAAVFKFLINQLDTPAYDDPTEVVLHYGLMDEKENIYGCSEEEGEKFGSALFSLD